MSKELNDEDFLLDMAQARLTNSEVCIADGNAYCVGCWRGRGVKRYMHQTKQENTYNCAWCSELKTHF